MTSKSNAQEVVEKELENFLNFFSVCLCAFVVDFVRDFLPQRAQNTEKRRRLLGHLCELVGEGIDHEFESIGDAKLRVDGAEMMRDSGWTDEESFGDLFVL